MPAPTLIEPGMGGRDGGHGTRRARIAGERPGPVEFLLGIDEDDESLAEIAGPAHDLIIGRHRRAIAGYPRCRRKITRHDQMVDAWPTL